MSIRSRSVFLKVQRLIGFPWAHSSIFSGVPTNAQLVLHIVRVAERAYTPFPLPPPPPTASHMKAAVAANGIEDDTDSEEETGHSIEAGSLAGKKEGDEDDESTHSTKDKVIHTGKKKFASAFRKVAKKAATFRADVQVEGDTARQKVNPMPFPRSS